AFPLNGLNENSRHFFRRQCRLEQLFLDVTGATQRKLLLFLRASTTAAIGVGIAHVRDSRNQRGKTPSLLWFGGGERKRPHGAPVECTEEGDDVLPSGVIAGKLQRA